MSKRALPFVLVCLFSCAGCEQTAQGYFGPCDESVGMGMGCDPEADNAPTTPADACMKLARCGILNVHTDPPDDDDGWVDPLDRCVLRVQQTLGQDPGALVLECIEDSTCADLSATKLPDDDPDNITRAEAVIGWCGRLDPR